MARRHIMESTFRLNLLNPQHAKINEVIKGLNPKIYKSKNQFLIEACEFYIDHYGEDDIPSKEEKRYEQFVTRDEIEKIKKEIEYSAMSEARKEVISVHGKVFETTNDKNGYAKALGKPVLLIGICVLLSGVIAVVLPKDYAISIAVVFILFIAVVAGIWLYKIQKRFS